MNITLIATGVSFVALLLGLPLVLGVVALAGAYDIVERRRCHVYVLFGNVLGVLDEPGLYFLWPRLGSGGSSSSGWDNATSPTCVWIRRTYAASRSTPRKVRQWGWASGTRCSSANPLLTCSRTSTRGVLWRPTWATRPFAAEQHAAGEDAGGPTCDEPDRTRGGHAQVEGVGL